MPSSREQNTHLEFDVRIPKHIDNIESPHRSSHIPRTHCSPRFVNRQMLLLPLNYFCTQKSRHSSPYSPP